MMMSGGMGSCSGWDSGRLYIARHCECDGVWLFVSMTTLSPSDSWDRLLPPTALQKINGGRLWMDG